MTYSELIEEINADETGLAKGYSISFLQNEHVSRYKPESLQERIARDLKYFKLIEKDLLQTKEPKNGDFVEYEDGKFARICSLYDNNTFQLSNEIGVYVSDGGCTQVSGCAWDPEIEVDEQRLKLKNLSLTKKTKKGECWTFSGGIAGGDRGVWFEISFKVWSLCKTDIQ